MEREVKPQRGFTLLEMLLALAIFALLSLAGYQVLQGSLRSQQQSQQHIHRLSELTRLFAVLEQDVQHAVIRPTDVIDRRSAFRAGEGADLLQLTRRNILNPLNEARSNLEQIEWRFEQQTLTRTRLNEGTTLHFRGIEQITLRFYSAGAWRTDWTSQYSLPQAIDVTLHTTRWGTINRILLLDVKP